MIIYFIMLTKWITEDKRRYDDLDRIERIDPNKVKDEDIFTTVLVWW